MNPTLLTVLTAATTLLQEVQVAPRTSKGLATKITTFLQDADAKIEAAKNAPSRGTGDGLLTWRLAWVINPKTGSSRMVVVNKDGTLPPSTQKVMGDLYDVDEWTEIRTKTLKEARERIEAGEGTKVVGV